MLLAVALLSGAAFASTSFSVGIPSGWLFIFTPWAIWFFLEERLLPAAVVAALAIYSHLGGYLTAPLGITMGALIASRWRQLFKCGAIIAVLTLPYTIHVIRYAGWLSGAKSHSALLVDQCWIWPRLPLRSASCGLRVSIPSWWRGCLRRLLGCLRIPAGILLQWPLGGSVAAGWLLANKVACVGEPHRVRYAIGIAALATFLPFGLPSLSGEIAWAGGNHYPLAVDWSSARLIAGSIDHAGLARTLITDYSPALCPAIAVYADVSCEKGGWIEVQPRSDPAEGLSAANKTYSIPLAPANRMLASLKSLGWINVYNSGAVPASSTNSSVVRLIRSPSIPETAALASATITAEAQWLGRDAVNNALSYEDLLRMSTASGREQFQRVLAIQRGHAGRIELACIVYAWALERGDPQDARAMRQVALKMGDIASYLGDDFALDFLSQSRLAELKEQFFELATRSNRLALDPSPSPELMANFITLLSTGLKSRGDMFPASCGRLAAVAHRLT